MDGATLTRYSMLVRQRCCQWIGLNFCNGSKSDGYRICTRCRFAT